MSEIEDRAEVASWIGRKVTIIDGIGGTIGEHGIVLAVDFTPYRPAAWVKVNLDRDYPGYRSCELCWLEDERGEVGPVWGSPPHPVRERN